MVRRLTSLVFVAILLAQGVPLIKAAVPGPDFLSVSFREPADALSARAVSKGQPVRFSFLTAAGWTGWQTLAADPEDPDSLETDLFMFPVSVSEIRIRGVQEPSDVHPITVSKEPVKTRVAATGKTSGKPVILSRSDWGADDSYLFEGTASSESSSAADSDKGDLGTSQTQPTQRISDCLTAQQKYPEEFAVKSTVKKDASGRTYRWPLQYSKNVQLLVVHHTGLVVRNDPRPPVERVRALYKYHALSKGWGDIGYNYVIDETGQIYEGRTGGEGVVAGHAYCNNIGTIGVVLLGNFEIEQPSQDQVKSLQWLLRDLAQEYHLDVSRPAQFHGKKLDSPIVRHKDLLSTLCPGYYLAGAFAQIVSNVRTGNIYSSVVFPLGSGTSSSSSSSARTSSGLAEGISFIGRNAITINPGGKQRLSFTYTTGLTGAYEGKRIAEVRLSDPAIKLWVDDGVNQIPVTTGILLPYDLPAFESLSVQLIFQSPINPGNYWMEIGGVHFAISVAGRRARTGVYINQFHGNEALVVKPVVPKTAQTALKLQSAARRLGSALSSSASSSAVPASVPLSITDLSGTKNIRVRLSASNAPIVTFANPGTVNGVKVLAGTPVQLLVKNSRCLALSGGEPIAQLDVLRLSSPASGVLSVDSVKGVVRSFVGTIECRVLNGSITLINELPLEEYLAGLSEEPDSEPFEKQRAFAIAARTYAAYYLQTTARKFPGMPFDGSDDPATFQAYGGINWAGQNPRWTQAVTSTAGQVLKIDSQLIKPPYFSSDDGRTRSPIEAGWSNFPFASVFSSKSDPWCQGLPLLGHGVGMSGCGARGQATEGHSAEQILQYYYPGVRITQWQ